jgi:hypothetical protein
MNRSEVKNVSAGVPVAHGVKPGCLGCLVIPGLVSLPLIGIISGIFPWVGIALLIILAVGLFLTFRNWRNDPKLVVNILVAGFLLFTTVGCSAVTNIKFGGWLTDPVIPTARGVVSRQEWFTKDYLEGYKSWRETETFPKKYINDGFLWFYFLVVGPLGSIASALEVGTALLLPKKLFHVINDYAPSVPDHIKWSDDPFNLWFSIVKAHYFDICHETFSGYFHHPCPQGNCEKEWSYFWGVEDFYVKWNK